MDLKSIIGELYRKEVSENEIATILFSRKIFVSENSLIDKGSILGDNILITGDVSIGRNTVVFNNCIIQGDIAPIKIGKGCCIVDGCLMHNKILIDDMVHIAHGCLIHNRKDDGKPLKIGFGTLIGFGCQIHSSIGKCCQIAPGIIIDQEIPDYHFVFEKRTENGLKKLIISEMRKSNYLRILKLYKNFWGRKLLLDGKLQSLMWDGQYSNISEEFKKVLKRISEVFPCEISDAEINAILFN